MAEVDHISLEEAMAQLIARLTKFAHDLGRTKVDDEHDWFRNMIVGILISTQQNYQTVEAGMLQKPTLACWGARNLLELRVITTYVLRSPNNAMDFADDMAADTREFWESMQEVGRFTHTELITETKATAILEDEPAKSLLLQKAIEYEQAGPDLKELEGQLARINAVIAAFEGNLTHRPKTGRAIAQEVEESNRYNPRFKVLSKIVHPTAFSILAETRPGSLDVLLPLVGNQAAADIQAIFYAVEEHIATHGIGWPS